ncbi:beta-phosphoglucomutase [Natronospora cellulosivora (SeqCode)]
MKNDFMDIISIKGVVIINKNIEAFIFDLDGVITDTAEFHFLAWKRLAEEEGISFTRQDNEKLRGVSRRKSLEILLNGKVVSEVKMQEMMNQKNNYYQDYVKTISSDDLLPGIKEILDYLKENDYKLAVASASKNAKEVIENLEITDSFEHISDGFSVENTKPAPDLFLYTAEKLKVKTKNCVVIEDAESGVEAAIKAGMITVGVGPKERVGKADFRYDQVIDINIEEILNN